MEDRKWPTYDESFNKIPAWNGYNIAGAILIGLSIISIIYYASFKTIAIPPVLISVGILLFGALLCIIGELKNVQFALRQSQFQNAYYYSHKND